MRPLRTLLLLAPLLLGSAGCGSKKAEPVDPGPVGPPQPVDAGKGKGIKLGDPGGNPGKLPVIEIKP
ncbi:MAG: hypothetical protein C0501_06335 [Isosphaera sp.]|nr:hypothetical protein [Isosphaera sp.]